MRVLLSFGQAVYFGVGSYVCAFVLKHIYPSIFLALFGSVIIITIFALIIGFICVRFPRMYFVMLTVVFGELIYGIGYKWVSLTGENDWLVGIPIPAIKI